MSMGVVICGICGNSSEPCCGCRDFTTGGQSNAITAIDPILLARSLRREAHEAAGGGQSWTPATWAARLTKAEIAENMRRLREQGSGGADLADYV